MKYRATVAHPVLVLAFAFCGHTATLSEQADSKQQTQQQPKAEEKTASLTGCVDEQEGHYLLVDERNMSPIANLEADGFPKESFAKHLGHKVTVRGTSISSGNRPTFKVRSIDTVSEVCGPR